MSSSQLAIKLDIEIRDRDTGHATFGYSIYIYRCSVHVKSLTGFLWSVNEVTQDVQLFDSKSGSVRQLWR